ncbi:MAG: multidrug effflux MFS transporter [Burkholderiaceae bacterium]|nr:multidrug effflux MFS transporter [Burkholderiaceae bacterium]
MSATRPPARVPIALLAFFTLCGTLAIHIFVPVLPLAARDMAATAGAMQLTVSLYIAGLCAGQLFYGPLSDLFGRKPMLMIGLGLYTVCGLIAAVATSVDTLIAARLFQALGGCAGLVLGRSIARDTSQAHDAAHRIAVLSLVAALGPAFAPVVGSALAAVWGWRSILYALVGLGVANLLCCWYLLPETAPFEASEEGKFTQLLRNCRRLLKSPAFVAYSVGAGCNTTAIYAFITAAPFIFMGQMSRQAHEVGLYLGLLAMTMVFGSLCASRLIRSVPSQTLLRVASAASVLSTFVFLYVAMVGQLSVAWVMGPLMVYGLSAAIVSPAATAEALSVHPDIVGSASGLYGFIHMFVGVICTVLVGLGSNPAVSAAAVLVGAGVVAQTGYWIAARDRRAAA